MEPSSKLFVSPVSVLVRRLAGPFCLAYAPHGPALASGEELGEEGFAAISCELESLAKEIAKALPHSCLALRFDLPQYVKGVETFPPRLGPPFRKAADVQPPDTVILDLSPDEDLILAAMKPKWRYNIRLGEKKGLAVAEEGRAALHVFYGLYETTSRRDKIALHPASYYERLFEAAASDARAPVIELWVARHEGEPLAAIICLIHEKRAVYLYGASSDRKRNLMPSYALQWAAIRSAKARGATSYDFFGIPPNDDPEHPMAGLYRFKTGFGGAVVHRMGAWDLPLIGLPYALYRLAEDGRLYWHKVVKKGKALSRTRAKEAPPAEG